MTKLLLMRGLPASGKSTFARALVDNSATWKRVNRDTLRDMIDCGQWSQSKEKYIKAAELALAELYLKAGFNVVVDDCNLSPDAQRMWQEFAGKMDVRISVQDFTHVSPEECTERDKHRPNYVSEARIWQMYRDYLAPNPPVVARDPGLPDALLCDMDGTLALLGNRNPYDASTCEQDLLNVPVADIVLTYARTGIIILLVSGRGEQHRPESERWLARHAIPYKELFMRPEGDNRKDAIVKREMYEQRIQGHWNILFALDDRNQMVQLYRSLGLTCLQVADGDF